MFKKPHCSVIALEEHYWDEELAKTFTGSEAARPGLQMTQLLDLGALRIKEMDEASIDVQVLSHGAPSTQKLPAETAVAMARRVNDRLHKVVAGNPSRFAAFAALPTAVPEAAADELERTVKLGFNSGNYLTRTMNFVETIDVASGLAKAAVFGFLIALMGCYQGYNSKGGAQGVGSATTLAVVSASILILAFDYVLTEMFFAQ